MSDEEKASKAKFSRRKMLTALGATGAVLASGGMVATLNHRTQTESAATNHDTIEAEQILFRYDASYPVRTVEDKLKEWVSVKDFGAKGDESQNDSPAIQAAIDHALQTGKKEVYFPPGTYKDVNALQHTSSVSLIGDGVTFVSGRYRTIRLSEHEHKAISTSRVTRRNGPAYADLKQYYFSPAELSEAQVYYRLPTLVQTSSGRVVCAFSVFHGSNADIGQDEGPHIHYDIGIKISDSNGIYWSTVRIVASKGAPYQLSEPCILYQSTIGRIWIFFTYTKGKRGWGHGQPGFSEDLTPQQCYIYSDDDAATWSDIVNITELVKPEYSPCCWTPPTGGLETHQGHLLVPLAWLERDNSTVSSGFVLSKDQGTTWTRTRIAIGQDGGEIQVFQLADGSLMSVHRGHDAGNTRGEQKIFRSFDYGITWEKQPNMMITASAKGSLAIVGDPAWGDNRSLMVFSTSMGGLTNPSLWYSTNQGYEWAVCEDSLFDPSEVAVYSATIRLQNGNCLTIFEGAYFKHWYMNLYDPNQFIGPKTIVPHHNGLLEATGHNIYTLIESGFISDKELMYNQSNHTIMINDQHVAKTVAYTTGHGQIPVTDGGQIIHAGRAAVFEFGQSATISEIKDGYIGQIVHILSTSSAATVTLVKDASDVSLENRVRYAGQITDGLLTLVKTSVGWYVS